MFIIYIINYVSFIDYMEARLYGHVNLVTAKLSNLSGNKFYKRFQKDVQNLIRFEIWNCLPIFVPF